MMIQQMMMLMHLEMALRQQALVSYQEAQDADQRIRRLDDVMALNEQLNEVGSILSMLLNAPFDRGEAAWRAAAAAAGFESPVDAHHSPSSIRHGHSLSPGFHLQQHYIDSDDDDDTIEASADEATDVSYATSNVDDSEEFDEAGSLSVSTVVNGYNFDSLARRNGDNVTVGGRFAGSRAHVVSGSGTDHWQAAAAALLAPSSSAGFSDHSSVLLSRRRDRQSTPRRMAVEQPAVSVTVNVLHLPASVQPPATLSTTTAPHTSTLQHVQSTARGVASVGRTPLTQNSDHMPPPAVTGRQRTGSSLTSAAVTSSTSSSSRRPEPPSRNRLPAVTSVVHGTRSQQTLPESRQQVSSGNCDVGSTAVVSTSQATNSSVNRSQPSADSSSVLTEPWPMLPTAEAHTSASLSTNRSAIAHRAVRHDGSQQPQIQGRLARSIRPVADVTTHGPQRAVQQVPVIRPTLPLRRASVRNTLGRPAAPASVRPRMIPLPHPPATTRQQSFSNQGAAGSRTQASRDMLRPRRRSEIAHEIMFPPRNDTEQ